MFETCRRRTVMWIEKSSSALPTASRRYNGGQRPSSAEELFSPSSASCTCRPADRVRVYSYLYNISTFSPETNIYNTVFGVFSIIFFFFIPRTYYYTGNALRGYYLSCTKCVLTIFRGFRIEIVVIT